MGAVDLPGLILALRPDLCRRFGFGQPGKADDYLAWLLTSGLREYKALREDTGFLQTLGGQGADAGLTRLQSLIYRARPDVQKAFPLPAQCQPFLQWFWVHGVGELALWPLLSRTEQLTALREAEAAQSPWLAHLLEQGALAQVQAASLDTPLQANLPFGVNLIGYAFGQLGIGEDLRMTARALQAAGVPMAIVNFRPGQDISQNDLSLANHVLPEGELGPYAINLFCMTALETGRFYAEQGHSQFEHRHNIGYWPWELSRWPEPWKLAHPLVHEVWVSTEHIRDALQPAMDQSENKPVHVMPLVVEPEPGIQGLREINTQRATRRKQGLPLQAKLFCFSFDLNSSMHRKNPQACVQGFLRAFPRDGFSRRQVGLVIKTHAPRKKHRAWEQLKALAAQDDRIHIVEGTLPRTDLLALYAACDCFVSLHRAEGFGRGLAEALQLGLHLIATDYSGNTDFCRRPEFAQQVSLVPYRLVKVRPGQYPYAEGQVWASPSVQAAAKAMRRLYDSGPQPAPQVPSEGWACFSAKELGKVYAARLHALQQH
jgi:glycosyltransferase involved in cell wall biosynthesis